MGCLLLAERRTCLCLIRFDCKWLQVECEVLIVEDVMEEHGSPTFAAVIVCLETPFRKTKFNMTGCLSAL